MEAMELYEASEILTMNGGKLVQANTDNVIAEFQNQKQIDKVKEEMSKVFWDTERKVPKYKEESHLKLTDRMEKANEKQFIYKKPHYNISYDPSTNDFAGMVTELLDKDQSFQVSCRAGTGKTTFMKMICAQLDKREIKYQCLSPTNVACRLMHKDAQTIDCFFAQFCPKAYAKLNSYKYLIIDEKSMIKELWWRLLLHVKMNTTCKFILAGDWNQLEPVKDRSEKFEYEKTSVMHYLSDGNLFLLSHCRRSDRKMFDLCENPDAINTANFPKT